MIYLHWFSSTKKITGSKNPILQNSSIFRTKPHLLSLGFCLGSCSSAFCHLNRRCWDLEVKPYPKTRKWRNLSPKKGTISKRKSLIPSIESWLSNGDFPIMGFLIHPITKGSVSSPIYPKQPGPFFHCSLVYENLGLSSCHVGFRGCEDNPGWKSPASGGHRHPF